MTPKKWEQAKQLYEAALKIEPRERPQFLADNCDEDEELRVEVESLLASADESGDFLEKPAVGEMAEIIVKRISLAGRHILHYHIIGLLGSGGMGEVYLAEDTRLKRQIALKILPDSLSENKHAVQRFEREACAASALNHPNILTVHEFGEKDGLSFIATEYVKGETLRERLKKEKALSLTETLEIALQVAAALRAAHASGIIHRDIKPENVMIREDGLVKVLDFGLAKLTFQKNEPVDNDGETLFNTTRGIIMGTAAYMSPEQARGLETDARTDLWSFGAMLYEMLAGRSLFEGETASDTIASILMLEPELSEKELPPQLSNILRKALQKDREKRYQNVDELLLDLDAFRRGEPVSIPEALRTEESANFAAGLKASLRSRLTNRNLLVAGALLLVLAGGSLALRAILGSRKNPPPATRITTPQLVITWESEANEQEVVARFSPNGTMIAYTQTKDGQSSIWTKQIPDGDAKPVTKESKWNSFSPVWSPDNQRIAFISDRDNHLGIWSIPFSGSGLTYIGPVEDDSVRLIKWSRDGKIYFHRRDPDTGLNVFAIGLSSKEETRITHFDHAAQAQFFSISPDDKSIAYSSASKGGTHIFVVPTAGGESEQVTTDDQTSDEYPFWLADGKRIIYSAKRNGTFQTCIFDRENGRVEQLDLDYRDTLIADVAADTGQILFLQTQEGSDLWKAGIDGKGDLRITSGAGIELWPNVSPDGKDIVFQATSESKHVLEGKIMRLSMEDNHQIRITDKGFSPAFSHDGQKVAFLRESGQDIDLWIAGRNGDGERQLTSEGISFPGYNEDPYSRVEVRDFMWSPDGKNLIFCAKKEGLWNVWRLAADGSGTPERISDNRDVDVHLYSPTFAADGIRIAWTSFPEVQSPDGINPTALFVWNGKSIDILKRSDSIIKLIGWAGDNLVIALPAERSTSKPVRVTLSLISADTREKEFASINEVNFNNIQLSSDGSQVALATREDGKDNIKSVSVPGGRVARVTENVDPYTFISDIAWAPDGKTVFFGKQKRVITITMVEDIKQ